MLSWLRSSIGAGASATRDASAADPSKHHKDTTAVGADSSSGWRTRESVDVGYGDGSFGSRIDLGATAYPPTPSASSEHHFHPSVLASTNGCPPLRSTFNRLERQLSQSSPALLDSLAPPLLPTAPALISLMAAIAPYTLPQSVIDAWLVHDGQDLFASSLTGDAHGLAWGLWWMSVEEVETEWRFWRKFEDAGGEMGMEDAFTARAEKDRGETGYNYSYGEGRPHPYVGEHQTGTVDSALNDYMSSIPPGWVRRRYSHPGWLPLLTDRAGNYIGVDLDPPPPPSSSSVEGGVPTAVQRGGQAGQVIAFGREIDEKVVLFGCDSKAGWGRFWALFTDDVEANTFSRLGEGSANRRARRSDVLGSSVVIEVDGLADGHSSGDEDDGDGLGDVGYFESDRFGDEGGGSGAEVKLWHLRSEYRRWLANEGEGGIVGALAERSRRSWASVGIKRPDGPPPFASGSGLPTVVENESDVTPKGSPSLMPSDSARASLEENQSTELLAPLSGDEPGFMLSPPSPEKIARFGTTADEPYAPEGTQSRSPDLLAASYGRFSPRQSQGPSSKGAKGRRGPPPPPAPLDLPTVVDLEDGLTSIDDYSRFGHDANDLRPSHELRRVSYGTDAGLGLPRTPEERSSAVFEGTPTRQALLPLTGNSPSQTALMDTLSSKPTSASRSYAPSGLGFYSGSNGDAGGGSSTGWHAEDSSTSLAFAESNGPREPSSASKASTTSDEEGSGELIEAHTSPGGTVLGQQGPL